MENKGRILIVDDEINARSALVELLKDEGYAVDAAADAFKALGKAADAPLCMTCGTKMRPAGSCYLYEGCGSTSGCS